MERSRWLMLGWLGALSACASPGPLDEDHEARLRRDLGELSEREARVARAAKPPEDEPNAAVSEAATVEDYVRLALARNPAIVAAEQRVARLRERPEQVRTLDDPMLEVTPIGEMAQTAAGEVTAMIGVSQRFPFPGTLAARGRLAEREARVAERELEQVRQSVAAETRRAYWNLYNASRALEITRRSREALAQIVAVAEAQYRAARMTQQDLLRSTVELANVDIELATLEQRIATAAARLNTLIDRPVGAPLPTPAPIEAEELEPPLEVVLAEAERSNPALARVREQAAAYRQRRELARLGRLPEFSISASHNLVDDQGLAPMATGDDQWWVGFGVSIPIWQNRRSAAEREAMRGVLESLAQLRAERNDVALRVQEALADVRTHERRAALLRDSIIPQARQTLDASLSAYRAGSMDFVAVADQWRQLLAFELMHEESLAATRRALADLAEAVGRADWPGWPGSPATPSAAPPTRSVPTEDPDDGEAQP